MSLYKGSIYYIYLPNNINYTHIHTHLNIYISLMTNLYNINAGTL